MSVLEQRFAWTWQHALRGPALVREYVCCPGRRFRLDFAHPATKVGIELHGGIWTGGRHTTGTGFTRDCEKRCLLASQGWVLFELTSDMVLKTPLTWAGLIYETIRWRSVEVCGETRDYQSPKDVPARPGATLHPPARRRHPGGAVALGRPVRHAR